MIWIGIAAAAVLALAVLWWLLSPRAARVPAQPEEVLAPLPVLPEKDVPAPLPVVSVYEDEVEITLIRAAPVELLHPTTASAQAAAGASPEVPVAHEGDEVDVTFDEIPAKTKPFYPDDEPDAAIDEPTQRVKRFLMSACGQTDRGLRRRGNEDSFLMAEDHGVFVVADGMGGYAGGKIASELAVATLREIFETQAFTEPLEPSVPRRGAEIAWAVQKANAAVFARAQAEPELSHMGTTIVAARFSPDKQRTYIAHVGDSRAYRFRAGKLRRLTTDHTMQQLGYEGKGADHLYRAIGVAPTVDVDLIIDKPRPADVYLFCSDGLTKMASEDDIANIMLENIEDPEATAFSLIEVANDHGGRDNVTCIVVKVVERIHEVIAARVHTLDVG